MISNTGINPKKCFLQEILCGTHYKNSLFIPFTEGLEDSSQKKLNFVTSYPQELMLQKNLKG